MLYNLVRGAKKNERLPAEPATEASCQAETIGTLNDYENLLSNIARCMNDINYARELVVRLESVSQSETITRIKDILLNHERLYPHPEQIFLQPDDYEQASAAVKLHLEACAKTLLANRESLYVASLYSIAVYTAAHQNWLARFASLLPDSPEEATMNAAILLKVWLDIIYTDHIKDGTLRDAFAPFKVFPSDRDAATETNWNEPDPSEIDLAPPKRQRRT
ncbi:hypothetical protein HDV00_011966 [Rhizophlyctis rosea]|nr:hypothetical protein HDV00_011966 [Rhizophlyctis rosea]